MAAMPPPPVYSFSRAAGPAPGVGGPVVNTFGGPSNTSAAAHPDTIGQATANSFGAEAPPGNRFTASTGKNTILGG